MRKSLTMAILLASITSGCASPSRLAEIDAKYDAARDRCYADQGYLSPTDNKALCDRLTEQAREVDKHCAKWPVSCWISHSMMGGGPFTNVLVVN